jgi:pyruvate dehydrogenase kinase 2/3/4
MLISRISRRVLAEHHLALSDSFHGNVQEPGASEPHVGIIYTGLNVKRSIDKCTTLLEERLHGFGENHCVSSTHWPAVIVDGHLDTNFAYIKEHLEFVSYLEFVVQS